MNSHAVDGQTILHQLVIIGNISQRCKQWDNNPTINGISSIYGAGVFDHPQYHQYYPHQKS